MASNLNAMPTGEDEPLLQPKRKSMKSIVVTSLAVSLRFGQRRRRAQEERMNVPRATDENELFRETAPHALPYYAHKRFSALHVSPHPRVYNYSLP